MSENVLRDKKMHSDLLPTERFGLPQSLDRLLWQPSLPATARTPSEKSSSLVSVAKLVDFERGQVSCADFIGIIVLPRR
jgi:hypothetical protein